ncbi:MAG: sensor histidine kinase [Coriobacteriaceae bacterium]|nr:sensor histidine kinase [Coriobacteriaceae bacterium]
MALFLIVLLVVGMFAQFALNGHDGQQGIIYLWLIAKYLLLCLALRFYMTMSPPAILFYATIYLLTSDLCLMLVVRAGFLFFDGDLLTVGGSFLERIAAHMFLITFKLITLWLIWRFVPRKVYGISNLRKALFVVLPVIPYIYMRDFPNWLHTAPSQIPDSVQFMTVLTGICALVMMLGNERLTYQVIEAEKQGVNDIIQRRHEQLIAHSSTVDEVNRRYHDLKHLLQGIESMQNIDEIKAYAHTLQSEIQAYEHNFATGNEAVDVVLSDKARLCKEKDIRLIPIINTQGWDKISPIDISTIFGNALDNAIESAEQIEQDDKRRITVRVGQVNKMLVARFENYFNHSLKGNPHNLTTTKKVKVGHGYGMKSIRHVVERLQGEMSVDITDGRFVLTVLLPLP